jgi:hypothetical protein
MTRLVALSTVIALCACAPEQPPAVDSTYASHRGLAARESAVVQQPSATTPTPVAHSVGSPHRGSASATASTSPRPSKQKKGSEKVRLADVIDSSGWVGRTVRTAGRCRGYGAASDAGPPPISRSDWLLEDEGMSVYVNGAFPAGCPADSGVGARVTVVARIAEDTLRLLGARTGKPRRYLVLAPRR